MCLGIPGQLVELSQDSDQLARVDVAGVRRMINVGLLEDEALAPGDWVLIHVGFAMSKIDEDEAAWRSRRCKLMGPGSTTSLQTPLPATGRSAMRFVDEYRDPAAARALLAQHHRAGRRRRLQVHGGVRRPHPHHLPARHRARAAPERRARARARVPGLRHPHGPDRRRHRRGRDTRGDLHVLRRHDAGARRQRQPARGQGAGRRRPLRLLAARRAADRRREPRPRGGVLRGRVRDDRAVDRGHPAQGARRRRPQLQRLLQPRHDRAADQGDPRVARPPPRRLPRARVTCRPSSATTRTGSCPRSTASRS